MYVYDYVYIYIHDYPARIFPFNIPIYCDVPIYYRHTTRTGMTCTAEVLPMIAVCFLLAALLHADMNSGSLNPGAHKQGQASLKDSNNI